MSVLVCVGANTYGYAEGGGHLWEYLNWALGLRANGCDVVWLERVPPDARRKEAATNVAALRRALEPYGLADAVALTSTDGEALPAHLLDGAMSPEELDPDLFLGFTYVPPPPAVRARRTGLVDIDPGLLQIWVARGWLDISGYDVYFTVGETVGTRAASFPDAGIEWHYAPSCVALEWWPKRPPGSDGAFSTVSNWSTYDEWMEEDGEWYLNDKRAGFVPFLQLPRRTEQPLELALTLGEDESEESAALMSCGWRVRRAARVAAMPWDYHAYIGRALGEFSCAKPSCLRLRNAWVSNRTLCYLASGKPAVVQHTGTSEMLPDDEGLFRFRTLDEAARALDSVVADYDRQSRLARALAEERFDATSVTRRLLERALG
jgi:hypothetical protein